MDSENQPPIVTVYRALLIRCFQRQATIASRRGVVAGKVEMTCDATASITLEETKAVIDRWYQEHVDRLMAEVQ